MRDVGMLPAPLPSRHERSSRDAHQVQGELRRLIEVVAANRSMRRAYPTSSIPDCSARCERHKPDRRKRGKENEPEGIEGGVYPTRGRDQCQRHQAAGHGHKKHARAASRLGDRGRPRASRVKCSVVANMTAAGRGSSCGRWAAMPGSTSVVSPPSTLLVSSGISRVLSVSGAARGAIVACPNGTLPTAASSRQR